MPIQCPVCESIQPDENILCSVCGWDLNLVPASAPAKLKVAKRAWELKKQRSVQMAQASMNQPQNQPAQPVQVQDQSPQGVHPRFIQQQGAKPQHNQAQPLPNDPNANQQNQNQMAQQQPIMQPMPNNQPQQPMPPQGQPIAPQQGQMPNQQGMPQQPPMPPQGNQQGGYTPGQPMPPQAGNFQQNPNQPMMQNQQGMPQSRQQPPMMPPQGQPPMGRNPYGPSPAQIGPANQGPQNLPGGQFQAQNAYGMPNPNQGMMPQQGQQPPQMPNNMAMGMNNPYQNPNTPPLPMVDPNTGLPYNNTNNNNPYDSEQSASFPQPVLTFDEDGNPIYTSVSEEETIDFNEYTLDTFERDPFETFDEFVDRIHSMGPVPVGYIKLIKSGYDIDTGRFPVEIEPEAEWFQELFPIKDELFLMLHRDLARSLYQSGEHQTLATRLIVQNGTLLIDNLVVLGKNKEEYIILSKDLMKERMRKEPEGIQSVISLPANYFNEEEDDEFEDDPLASLLGTATVSNQSNEMLKIPTLVGRNSVINVPPSGKPQQRALFGHEAQALWVDFATHGKILASASGDKTVRFWNVMTGFELMSLKGHTDWVNCLDFSPDGKLLATGGADNVIRLWDAVSGKVIDVLEGHTDWVKNVMFAPSGKVLASSGDDRIIRLWDVERRKQIKVMSPNQPRQIKAIAFSPDGRLLACATGEDKAVRIWDIQSGKEVRILPAQENWVESIAFSPDGKIFATGSYPEIKFWDITTGYELGTMMGHHSWVKSLSFSPNGKLLASGSCDRSVMIWDVANQELLKTLPRPRTPEEEVIERLKPNYIPIGHEDWVNCVTFSPDGNIVASASDDKSVRLWYLPDLNLYNQN